MRWKLTSATHSSTCGEIQRTCKAGWRVRGGERWQSGATRSGLHGRLLADTTGRLAYGRRTHRLVVDEGGRRHGERPSIGLRQQAELLRDHPERPAVVGHNEGVGGRGAVRVKITAARQREWPCGVLGHGGEDRGRIRKCEGRGGELEQAASPHRLRIGPTHVCSEGAGEHLRSCSRVGVSWRVPGIGLRRCGAPAFTRLVPVLEILPGNMRRVVVDIWVKVVSLDLQECATAAGVHVGRDGLDLGREVGIDEGVVDVFGSRHPRLCQGGEGRGQGASAATDSRGTS
eukprot:scaffold265340_cov30-Tisochrysis_lutea.AAC.5